MKNMKVNWDDDIPNSYGKISNWWQPNHQPVLVFLHTYKHPQSMRIFNSLAWNLQWWTGANVGATAATWWWPRAFSRSWMSNPAACRLCPRMTARDDSWGERASFFDSWSTYVTAALDHLIPDFFDLQHKELDEITSSYELTETYSIKVSVSCLWWHNSWNEWDGTCMDHDETWNSWWSQKLKKNIHPFVLRANHVAPFPNVSKCLKMSQNEHNPNSP